MRDSEDEAEGIDYNPQQIDDVVAVGRLNEWTGRMKGCRFDVVGQCARDEGRSQINGNGREPDHRDAKKDAMRSVEQASAHVGAETCVSRRRILCNRVNQNPENSKVITRRVIMGPNDLCDPCLAPETFNITRCCTLEKEKD